MNLYGYVCAHPYVNMYIPIWYPGIAVELFIHELYIRKVQFLGETLSIFP